MFGHCCPRSKYPHWSCTVRTTPTSRWSTAATSRRRSPALPTSNFLATTTPSRPVINNKFSMKLNYSWPAGAPPVTTGSSRSSSSSTSSSRPNARSQSGTAPGEISSTPTTAPCAAASHNTAAARSSPKATSSSPSSRHPPKRSAVPRPSEPTEPPAHFGYGLDSTPANSKYAATTSSASPSTSQHGSKHSRSQTRSSSRAPSPNSSEAQTDSSHLAGLTPFAASPANGNSGKPYNPTTRRRTDHSTKARKIAGARTTSPRSVSGLDAV